MQPTYKASLSIRSIDEHLLLLRRAQSGAGYRRRLLSGIRSVTGVGLLRVLRSIERADADGQRVSIGDVAVDLGVEHSTASRSVNDAARRGLIQRQACEDDQRRVLLDLTEEGRAAADQATQNRRAIVASALSDLSEDEMRQLDLLLGRLVAGLNRIEESPESAEYSA